MAELHTLLARIEAAAGPDRELDCALAVAVDGFFVDGEDPWGRPKYCYHGEDGGQISPGQAPDMLVRRYTASLDAALALVERVLPADTTFVLRKSTEDYWVRKGIPLGQWGVILNDNFGGWTVAKTPSLALLSALLSALIAESTSGTNPNPALSQPKESSRG